MQFFTFQISRCRIATAAAFAALAAGPAAGADSSSPDVPSFAHDIRPILADTCLNCHGFDAAERKAGLRLDTAEGAYADNDGVRAIVPGDLESSELWHRIRSDDPDEQMPPPDFHQQLTEEQIEMLGRWIEAGAVYEEHWSFSAPVRPEVPEVGQDHVIDAFVAKRLEREGIEARPRADRRTQIRRLNLALTGLPPSPQRVEAFVAADDEEEAYRQLVDELLASDRHAEHMARHWLDVARYADTHGYQYDLSRTQWPWRDWVIRAFRDNMPFDQFTIEQLAGDLLPQPTENQVLATAFNRNHPITIEGGIIDEEYRTEYVVDRVDTVGRTWLGLTLGCARCHDHKFDPVSAEDFYSFYAYFNRIDERGLGRANKFAPTMEVLSPLLKDRQERMEREIGDVWRQLEPHRRELDRRRAELEKGLLERQVEWAVPKPDKITTGGTTLERRQDGSLLAGNKRPEKDHYELTLPVRGPIRSIRVEALADESHPGVGRAENGNFVLTQIQAHARGTESGEDQRLSFRTATADFEQPGYEVVDALKENGRHGWAVAGGSDRDRAAVFELEPGALAEVAPDEEWQLVVRLDFDWGSGHSIGRLRLAVSEDAGGETDREFSLALRKPLGERSEAEARSVDLELLRNHGGDEVGAILGRLRELRSRIAEIGSSRTRVMVMRDKSGPTPTYVLESGLYDQPDKDRPVSARPLSAFEVDADGDMPANRLGLAKWMVSPDHPLTSRVLVNRLWQQLFGVGIVATSGDLGTQGELPSHPQLIDWLAVEMIESGWDVRAMLRLMVTSETFRRSSRAAPEAYAADPDNRLLARGPRVRLDAEAVRDNALAIAGLLVDEVGGPSVYPYHPDGLWQEVNNRPGLMETYEQGQGDDLYRRSMYTFWKRAVPAPAMQAFDAPNREYCVVQRSRTNTPLQALVLLHEPGQMEAARSLAERMLAEDRFRKRVGLAFQLALGRPPESGESEVLRDLLDRERIRFNANPGAAAALIEVGESRPDPDLDPIELAAHTTLARLILNLDETITRP